MSSTVLSLVEALHNRSLRPVDLYAAVRQDQIGLEGVEALRRYAAANPPDGLAVLQIVEVLQKELQARQSLKRQQQRAFTIQVQQHPTSPPPTLAQWFQPDHVPNRVTQSEFVPEAEAVQPDASDLPVQLLWHRPSGAISQPLDAYTISPQVDPDQTPDQSGGQSGRRFLLLSHATWGVKSIQPGSVLWHGGTKHLLLGYWLRNVRAIGGRLQVEITDEDVLWQEEDTGHRVNLDLSSGGNPERLKRVQAAPAFKAKDALRFLPADEVGHMVLAAQPLGRQTGKLGGYCWVWVEWSDGAKLPKPLLYVTQHEPCDQRTWEELYARLLLGEEPNQ